MRLPPILYGLVAYIFPLVTATALTYKLGPNEKACFFTYVEEKGAKLAFYFAVRLPSPFPLQKPQMRGGSDKDLISILRLKGPIRWFFRCRL